MKFSLKPCPQCGALAYLNVSGTCSRCSNPRPKKVRKLKTNVKPLGDYVKDLTPRERRLLGEKAAYTRWDKKFDRI